MNKYRFLEEKLSEIDEQGLLTIVHYCDLLSHFTGLNQQDYKDSLNILYGKIQSLDYRNIVRLEMLFVLL